MTLPAVGTGARKSTIEHTQLAMTPNAKGRRDFSRRPFKSLPAATYSPTQRFPCSGFAYGSALRASRAASPPMADMGNLCG